MRVIYILIIVFFSASFNSSAQIPTDGLVAYWHFNGNTSDSSGNGHNAILHGPILVNDRFMIDDMAYSFERYADDYIQTNINDNVFDNYTAAGWYYWNGIDNSHAIGTFLIGGKGWTWKIYNNRVRFLQANTALVSTFDIIPKTWFHVAVSFDGSVARLYINGAENISANADIGKGEDLFIGAIPKYMSVYNWDGYIDEVLVYNRALESNEINILYTDGLFVNDTVFVYDTIPVYDTITIIDSISVTDTLIIDIALSIPQPSYNTIKIYPNPTSDIIYISTGDYLAMDNYTIKIISSLGNIVFEELCNQPEFQIDINDFGATGIYFVQIIDNNNNIIDIRKILLE
ncbi:MAG: T9SS type A sorting domain-containing protein [Bacteroidota bacterium]